ncbi:WD40/YVTN/BNR-like repeat-containing protein [Roseateles violae]|uniref:YCF48-related protein n=1 Tax=Roseateles violae TaxID=3058042 RepID=A0ABT8DZG0_9BURK|nr:YCF48-related protein [Pelomonas sp. PFR6]MDN3922949.1 YCF48-related protein [Pelomonas sp. PFR6]
MKRSFVHRSLGLLSLGVALAALAAGDNKSGFRDVLDTPAQQSALAPRAPLSGLAQAGERIVAAGQRGHILWTDDAGAHWQQAQVPVSSDLLALSFPTPQQGWAVGHDGVILASSDAGKTWTRQLDGRQLGAQMVAFYEKRLAESPKEAEQRALEAALAEAKRFAAQGAETPLLDVWFADARQGYAVGAFGLFLQTRDGGQHWEPLQHLVENPKALHLYAVRGIAGSVYAVGEQGLALKLDPASGRFEALNMPYQGTLFGINGDAGLLLVHGLRGNALRSIDGGRSWTAVPSGLQVGLTASARAADGSWLLASQSGHVLASRDQAQSFQPLKLERMMPASALIGAGPRGLVMVGPRGAQAIPLP